MFRFALWLAMLPAVCATPAWAAAFDGRLAGVKGAEIGYRIYDNDDAQGAVVLINGFSETYLMYDELALPLVEAGYRVYTYDHRGQGVSDRLLHAIDVGFVDAFEDYVDDLALFMDRIVRPAETQPVSLLAHSTGGLIAVHYAAKHPEGLHRMVLSAPFFELNTRWAPSWLARAMFSVSCALGRCDQFAPTQGNFDPAAYAFEVNHLTHSRDRFDRMRDFVWGNPALLIRGASSSFLRETMRAGDLVPKLAASIRTPVLLFQAGIDDYVLPDRQNAFCAIVSCSKVVLADAYHELFFEDEPIRSEVLTKMLSFLAAPQKE